MKRQGKWLAIGIGAVVVLWSAAVTVVSLDRTVRTPEPVTTNYVDGKAVLPPSAEPDMTWLYVVIILVMYFLPFALAQQRHHHNALAIFWLNFFLGWTILGWIAAFIWACTSRPPAK